MDLGNLTVESTFDPDDTYTFEFDPLHALNGITSLASAIANALIIAVIIRNTFMHTPPNIYLINWCISNFIVVLLVPASLNLFSLFDTVSFQFMCIWENTIYGVLLGNLFFVLVLLLHWYLVNYTKAAFIKNKSLCWYIIGALWIVVLVISVTSVTFCILNWSYPLSQVCYLLGYVLIFIVIIGLFILIGVRIKRSHASQKSKIELLLVSSFFICWLPNCISMYAQLFLMKYFGHEFEQFTFFVGYSHAWIMLILLFIFDKSFQRGFHITFCCKRVSIEEANGNKEQSTGLL